MAADYLIVGQGIAGTLLGRGLVKEGCTIQVIDDGNPSSASRVAGGIINPVTGKRLVRSWMTDELLPFAKATYEAFGEEMEVPLVAECNILDMYATQDARTAFTDKLPKENEYLRDVADVREWEPYFRFNYGMGEIQRCLLLDIRAMLQGWRQRLQDMGALVEERFDMQQLIVSEQGVTYKNVSAKKIIFCEGAAGADNPYFHLLPWSKDKGEAIIAAIPGLPRNHIYKQGLSIVPWQDDLFWIGATHDWKFTGLHITAAFRKKVEEELSYWLKIPYTIVDHIVAQRPANIERKPFAGLHPAHSAVGILNGMGGKGCSMAPYFAQQLARRLVHGAPILPDADVQRFSRILKSGTTAS